MNTKLTEAIAKHGWPYETEQGDRFIGCPVSQLPVLLREVGWKNVSRDYSDYYALRDFGMTILTARYVGGARPKRFVHVVFGATSRA